MSNYAVATKEDQIVGMQNVLGSTAIKKQAKALLNENAAHFLVSLTNLFGDSLLGCDPNEVVKCAMVAATLKLPIEKSLGYAYVVPFKNKGKLTPSFQIGYKGLVQLAIRTAQYKNIGAIPIFEEEFIEWDKFNEELILDKRAECDQTKKPVGFAAKFKTITGFEKTVYWTWNEVELHARNYSQPYKAFLQKRIKSCLWTTDFNKMALKTVLKHLLSKWGILSVELQNVIREEKLAETGSMDIPMPGADPLAPDLHEDPIEGEIMDPVEDPIPTNAPEQEVTGKGVDDITDTGEEIFPTRTF